MIKSYIKGRQRYIKITFLSFRWDKQKKKERHFILLKILSYITVTKSNLLLSKGEGGA